MKSKYDYEIIRDYLHGLVDSKTAREIGELIKTDETSRSIAEGIVQMERELNGDDAVDKYLEDFRQRQLKQIPNAGSSVTKKAWIRIAASLLILIGVASVIRLMTALPDLQALVSKELDQPYPLSNLVRGEGDGTMEKAFALYSQGDFAKASIYFEQSSEGKENASVTFYNALSYLYAGNYEKASALLGFDVIVNSRYAQQGRWYQALALIQGGNKEKGKEALKMIANSEHHFKHEAAAEILELLE